MFLFQLEQSGDGDCALERGADREAAWTVERSFTG